MGKQTQPIRISKAAAIDIWKSQCAAAEKSYRNRSDRVSVSDLIGTLEDLHERLSPSGEDPLGFFLCDPLGQRFTKSKKVKGIRTRKRREVLARAMDDRLLKHLSKVLSILDDAVTGTKVDEFRKVDVLKLLVQGKHKRSIRKRGADDLRRVFGGKSVLVFVI